MTAQAVTPSLNQPLAELDPDIAEVLTGELARQRETLEMIASENFVPRAVLECQGSVLTNKYAEGYPGRRYYGGCEVVDVAESLAIERAKAVFDAEWANVQPHSGAQANAAVLHALATPGDTLLGLSLAHGGHLTHGMKINFSGKNYNATAYGVDETTMRIEMDQVREAALRERPTVIIAGWSAYPRHLDFAAFRAIADEVGAALWVDMAHFAGLVAAGLHPNPVPHADVVSTTVHKTLGGPRSGMLLSSRAEQWGKKLNSAVFPGQQGGPLMHVIAAKAVAMKIAGTEEFRERQERTVRGAAIIAERLGADDVRAAGVSLVTGGTDVHLVLVDLRDSSLDGQQAEDLLHTAGITVNRNAVPFDPRPPRVTSGLRIGTPGLGTVLVGEDPGSVKYVAGKHADCAEVGILSIREDLPATATQAEVAAAVDRLNADDACTGYIVQLPLPAGVDTNAILERVDPAKDADGLHPTNLGRLVLRASGPIDSPLPCTPRGCIELMERHGIDLAGRNVCVVGRGVTVGRSIGLLLGRKDVNATVDICHTGTTDLAEHVRRADVVISAAGSPGIITPEMVAPGAVVLDVGVSRVVDPATGKGRIAGDVADGVDEVASWLSPNPGGVGPMTRALLLANVVETAERSL